MPLYLGFCAECKAWADFQSDQKKETHEKMVWMRAGKLFIWPLKYSVTRSIKEIYVFINIELKNHVTIYIWRLEFLLKCFFSVYMAYLFNNI